MYSDVLRWTHVPGTLAGCADCFSASRGLRAEVIFRGGDACVSGFVGVERAATVTNGSADADELRAGAAHALLCQETGAAIQVLRCFESGQQGGLAKLRHCVLRSNYRVHRATPVPAEGYYQRKGIGWDNCPRMNLIMSIGVRE